MLRVIFDSNIYIRIAEDKNINIITEKIIDDKEFVVYGFKPIRKELRDIPKYLRLGRFNKRNIVLNLYDDITRDKFLTNNLKIESLARRYFERLKNVGANISWERISVDFMLIACATLNNIDLVVSEDNKMIRNSLSLETFNIVNGREGFRSPTFWNYKMLIEKYK